MKINEIINKWNTGNCDTLIESIMVPEINTALKDWIINAPKKYVIIGGLVVGYYTRPRMTTDIDVLYRSENDIPHFVNSFKKTREHAFQHKSTNVEVELLSPEFLNIPQSIVDKVFSDSVKIDNAYVPTPSGVVALKICRASFQDLADIENIVKKHDIDLSNYDVPHDKLDYVEKQLNRKLK